MEKKAESGKMELPVDIHWTVVSSVTFFISKCCYFIQNSISWILWHLFISWVIRVFRNKKISDSDSGKVEYETPKGARVEFEYTVDMEHWPHRFCYKYLAFAGRINRKLSGLVPIREAYSILLGFDPMFRFIGYGEGETIRQIEVLGRSYQSHGEKVRGWDVVFYTRPKASGAIATLKKSLISFGSLDNESSGHIRILGCWVSGQDAGKIFLIDGRPTSIADLERRNKSCGPSHIYIPPRWIAGLIQFALISGVLIAAISQCMTLIRTLLKP